MSHPSSRGGPQGGAIAVAGIGEDDVANDGQEEVFSRTALERGMVEDPKALSPEQIAQNPKTRGPIDRIQAGSARPPNRD